MQNRKLSEDRKVKGRKSSAVSVIWVGVFPSSLFSVYTLKLVNSCVHIVCITLRLASHTWSLLVFPGFSNRARNIFWMSALAAFPSVAFDSGPSCRLWGFRPQTCPLSHKVLQRLTSQPPIPSLASLSALASLATEYYFHLCSPSALYSLS